MTLFSICIPAYEMSGYGHEMLENLFQNLMEQTFQDFEIIVSDQSKDYKTLEVCEKYSEKIIIKYVKNFYKKGVSAHNLNTCLDFCVGEIIKIMFEDDYFVDRTALEKIYYKFKNDNCKWVANGFIHTYDCINYFNPMIPKMNQNIIMGNNTMGSPSNISLLKECIEHFDENLLMMVDCEFYYRMNLLYGPPGILEYILCASRFHEKSATNNPEINVKLQEDMDYCHKKYLSLQ